jgi:hypothetical protein
MNDEISYMKFEAFLKSFTILGFFILIFETVDINYYNFKNDKN